MGVRYRSATPGTLLSLGATIILALVSFNTPLLKSIYFLEARFSTGQYAGSLRLGTLGYCLDTGSGENCNGPRVGYQFDPNELLGVTMFDIPEAITKYLTYVLIIHIVALALALASTIFGLLSHISSLSVLCFPTCFAACASTCSLIALVFDLAMFYIAKTRIDRVSGASASIGVAVWLTLAAWLLCGFAGCAYGVGRCCVGSRDRKARDDPQPNYGGYVRTPSGNGPDAMRMDAIRDEQLRKKEQGLPSFAEYERTPLTDREDKYGMNDPAQNMPGALRRDGSLVQGVGVGYGRRTDARTPVDTVDYNVGYANGYPNGQPGVGMGMGRRPSDSMMTDAGDAGLGAGGGGVEQTNYGQYAANDPYRNADPQYGGSYAQNGYNDPYTTNQQHQYPPQTHTPDPYATTRAVDPYATSRTPDPYATSRTPDPYAHNSSTPNPYGNTRQSNQYLASHTTNPYEQRQSAHDPYGGYDDGLGGIGMAATTPQGPSGYTGASYNNQPAVQAPQPQRLVSSNHANNLLRSPVSAVDDGYNQRSDVVGHNGYDNGQIGQSGGYDSGPAGPPSYGVATGDNGPSGYQTRPEKSGYH